MIIPQWFLKSLMVGWPYCRLLLRPSDVQSLRRKAGLWASNTSKRSLRDCGPLLKYIIPLTIPHRKMVGVQSHRKTFYSVRIGGQALILLEDTVISRSHISILLEPASATQAFYKMHGLHYLNQQVLLQWKETGSIKSIVSTYLMHSFARTYVMENHITNKMLKSYSLTSQVLKSNGLNLFE